MVAVSLKKFAPVIDQFLKEHLFADIFERDVLSYADREVVTLSALTTLGGVDLMLAGHTRIALGQGISQAQLIAVYQVLENILTVVDRLGVHVVIGPAHLLVGQLGVGSLVSFVVQQLKLGGVVPNRRIGYFLY